MSPKVGSTRVGPSFRWDDPLRFERADREEGINCTILGPERAIRYNK
jgi:hypothetical protein